MLCALGFLEEESQTCYLDNVRGEAFDLQEIAAAQLHFNLWRWQMCAFIFIISFFGFFRFCFCSPLHFTYL